MKVEVEFEKSAWNEFKDELKSLLKEQGISYQGTEKHPSFRVHYEGKNISVLVSWESDRLLVTTETQSEDVQTLNLIEDIVALLELFDGQKVI